MNAVTAHVTIGELRNPSAVRRLMLDDVTLTFISDGSMGRSPRQRKR